MMPACLVIFVFSAQSLKWSRMLLRKLLLCKVLHMMKILVIITIIPPAIITML